jgi:hypothetical protein
MLVLLLMLVIGYAIMPNSIKSMITSKNMN